MRIICLRAGGLAALLAATAAFSQTPPSSPLAFEVASIKPAGPLDPVAIQKGKMNIGMKVDGAICNIGSFSLRDLIRTAYEVKDFQITGADSLGSPLDAQRFNIQATMPNGATEKQVPQMLQTLLAERFKLVVRRETKDQSVYALVVAKGGPKLKESEPDPPTAAVPAEGPEAPKEAPKKGEMVLGQGSNQVRISGNIGGATGMTVKGGPMGQMRVTMADGRMHMEAAKMNMPSLADVATTFAGRPVVDMTELKGNYQVTLDLSMDDLKNIARSAGMTMPGGPGGNGGPVLADASDPSGSTIFVSIQQMGLKLEARKAPLPFIVIEHLEKSPTEN
jgi:uncharacterized protein (TIGR03435 family)